MRECTNGSCLSQFKKKKKKKKKKEKKLNWNKPSLLLEKKINEEIIEGFWSLHIPSFRALAPEALSTKPINNQKTGRVFASLLQFSLSAFKTRQKF